MHSLSNNLIIMLLKSSQSKRHWQAESLWGDILEMCAAYQLDDHRTNESVMNEIGADRELVATVGKQKQQYFGQMNRAQNLCT